MSVPGSWCWLSVWGLAFHVASSWVSLCEIIQAFSQQHGWIPKLSILRDGWDCIAFSNLASKFCRLNLSEPVCLVQGNRRQTPFLDGMNLNPISVNHCRIWCLWQRMLVQHLRIQRSLGAELLPNRVGSSPLHDAISTHFPVLISERFHMRGRLPLEMIFKMIFK